MPQTASSILPPRQSPVAEGMNELEAGEALTNYMERVTEATGVAADDIDVFDGERNWEGVEQRLRGDASESSPGEKDGEGPDDPGRTGAPDDDPDAAPASTEETDENESTEETGDASPDDADADAITLEASHLAGLLGVEENAIVVGDDGSVSLAYQVDGQRGQTTLSEVLASYQLQGHVHNKSKQLSEESRQLREAVLRREQELHAAVTQAQSYQKAMEDRLVAKYSEVDWEALKASDPGRYAALQVDMSNEVQAIRGEAQRVLEAAQQQAHKSQQEAEYRRQQWMYEQQKLLFEHLPDLADEAKRPEILRGYETYLTGYGFTPDEVRNIHDHRFMRVIADAAAYRAAASKPGKPEGDVPVKKRLLKVPRVAKGSTPRSEVDRRDERKASAAARLRKSGSDDDAARFLVESGVADAVLGEG